MLARLRRSDMNGNGKYNAVSGSPGGKMGLFTGTHTLRPIPRINTHTHTHTHTLDAANTSKQSTHAHTNTQIPRYFQETKKKKKKANTSLIIIKIQRMKQNPFTTKLYEREFEKQRK